MIKRTAVSLTKTLVVDMPSYKQKEGFSKNVNNLHLKIIDNKNCDNDNILVRTKNVERNTCEFKACRKLRSKNNIYPIGNHYMYVLVSLNLL